MPLYQDQEVDFEKKLTAANHSELRVMRVAVDRLSETQKLFRKLVEAIPGIENKVAAKFPTWKLILVQIEAVLFDEPTSLKKDEFEQFWLFCFRNSIELKSPDFNRMTDYITKRLEG